MKLATFTVAGTAQDLLGVVRDDRIVNLTATAHALGLPFPHSMIGLIAGGGERAVRGLLERAHADRVTQDLPLDSVSLKAPLPRPGKIIGVGLNYVEHVEESSRTLDTDDELPKRPVLFDKPSTAVVGPEADIRHDSSLTSQMDWEVELAVIIGRRSTRVSAENAYQHVFGFTVVNDISARDQRRSGQWFFSKGQDSYAPLGPVIVTAGEIEDPQDLELRLRVNGETKQHSSTRHMLFKIPDLIADITSGVTLEPGDVVATGSPSGVGAGLNPPQFLRPGDVVEAEIEGIGVLRNRVRDVAGVPAMGLEEATHA